MPVIHAPKEEMAAPDTATLQGKLELLTRPPPVDCGSHYERSHVMVCASGETIAHLVAPDSADVHLRAPTLGHNVTWGPNGTDVVATAAGCVILRNNAIAVEEALQIATDVDFSTGNIDFNGNVVIRGNVLDLFKVRAAGNLHVSGVVEAAELDIGGSLEAVGGIAGKGKGHVLVAQHLHARYLNNASVRVKGDCTVVHEINNTTLLCSGHLKILNGSILSGQVTASKGLESRSIGSPAGTHTTVEIGLNPELHNLLLVRSQATQAQRKLVHELREKYRPITSKKNLTAAEKERVTEVLYEIEEAEAKLSEMQKEIKMAFDAARSIPRADLNVLQVVHAGVTVRFPGIETTITADMKGPICITACHNEGGVRILAIHPRTKQIAVLPGRSIEDPLAALLAHPEHADHTPQPT